MTNFHKEKIAAIVPAFNEEKNVGEVLKVLLSSKCLDEVILVDDGSDDKTAEVGKNLGAKVIKMKKNSGKGNAMKEAAGATDAEILVFFDADLMGLSEDHVLALVNPMLTENVAMCVGIRGRLWGLPRLIAKIDPLMAIGGERALRRFVFESIPEKFMQGFAVETALSYYCLVKKLPVEYVVLKNLSIITKEKKWGFVRGFKNRLKMIWQILKIRFTILFSNNEFI